MEIKLKDCDEHQLAEILDIFNDAILNSTALYDYKIRTMETMQLWYADKLNHNHPVIGAFDDNNKLLGFATYGQFRVRPAYKYTVEHSVYVQKNQRGLGLGSLLLTEIIRKAEEQNFHVMVGVIDATNDVSIKLHEKHGFKLTGIMHEVGYKFEKWLDAAFYQLVLKTPEFPTED